MRLYTLCSRSRKLMKPSRGSVVLIFPLQAGHRSDLVLSRSCSDIHLSMQSSCASRVHGQAFTQTAFGVSADVCRQMKQFRRLGSVCIRSRWGGGGAGEAVAVNAAPAFGVSSGVEDIASEAWLVGVWRGRWRCRCERRGNRVCYHNSTTAALRCFLEAA